MKDALILPIQTLSLLWNGFWPKSRFESTLKDQFIEDGTVRKKYNVDDHFIV